MAIAKLQQSLIRTLLCFSLLILAACGGGGSGSKTKDTTPNAISFTATTNAALNSEVTSAPITISGIDAAAPISITGGQYSIAGGAFTSSEGTINNGQAVTIKVIAAATNSTSVEAVLTIGGVSATYIVTTIADTTPNAFSFIAIPAAEPNSENVSNSITVMGISAATPISITGGEYSINGGAYTAVAGTVTANQTVAVKVIAPNGTDLNQTAVLTIGGVTGNYSVSTFADEQAPVAEFKFPTPYTMSEATSVKVRGTATDYNAITSVKVKVNTAEAFEVTPIVEGDYSSWTADIPLTADSENTVVVLTEDEKGNVADSAAQVVIRQAPVESAFPDEVNQFVNPSGGLVYDNYGGRNRLLVSDTSANLLIAVDLETGMREIYKDLDALNLGDIWGMSIDASDDTPVLYALEYEERNVLKINLLNGEIEESQFNELYREPRTLVLDDFNGDRRLVSVNDDSFNGGNSNLITYSLLTNIFSIASPSENEPLLTNPWGLAVDASHNRYLVSVGNQDADANKHGIYAIDRATGEHSIFSDNATGSGDLFSSTLSNGTAFLRDIAMDEINNRLIVPESTSNKLFSIDLDSGNRVVISDLSYLNTSIPRTSLINIYLHSDNQSCFITESRRDAVLMVDLETGQKVILSKSAN